MFISCKFEFSLNPSFFIYLFFKIIPRSSQVCAFEISDLFKAPSDSTLKPRLKSKEKYYNWYENNFCVLPDGNTLIGANYSLLKSEDITGNRFKIVIDQKRNHISTIIFNLNLNLLLVGDEDGCLSQYGRNPSGDFKKQKDYGDVGVGEIFDIDWSGNFAVVGGTKGKISLIDMKKRKVIANGVRAAIGYIYFLRLCRISESEMHLAVGGGGKDYSKSKTDLFDVSKLFNLRENKEENVKTIKKELIEQVKSISE